MVDKLWAGFFCQKMEDGVPLVFHEFCFLLSRFERCCFFTLLKNNFER